MGRNIGKLKNFSYTPLPGAKKICRPPANGQEIFIDPLSLKLLLFFVDPLLILGTVRLI